MVAFSLSSYSTCWRSKRSLNPLLSETFEYICPEQGLRLVSEQVRQSWTGVPTRAYCTP